MKKTTSLIEKLAEYQLDVDSTKNIKGGNTDADSGGVAEALGGRRDSGEVPPFGY
ncbi:MAG: hypothetical protein AAFZ15_11585 [Bacteroidota bacterium]